MSASPKASRKDIRTELERKKELEGGKKETTNVFEELQEERPKLEEGTEVKPEEASALQPVEAQSPTGGQLFPLVFFGESPALCYLLSLLLALLYPLRHPPSSPLSSPLSPHPPLLSSPSFF
jgi:hypothetical protein